MTLTLKSHREAAGLSTCRAASSLGVSQPAYTNWELGKALPTADKLPAIADLFGVSIDALFGRTPQSASPTAPLAGEPRKEYAARQLPLQGSQGPGHGLTPAPTTIIPREEG